MLNFLTSSTFLTMSDGRAASEGDVDVSPDEAVENGFQDVFSSQGPQTAEAVEAVEAGEAGETGDAQPVAEADLPDGALALFLPPEMSPQVLAPGDLTAEAAEETAPSPEAVAPSAGLELSGILAAKTSAEGGTAAQQPALASNAETRPSAGAMAGNGAMPGPLAQTQAKQAGATAAMIPPLQVAETTAPGGGAATVPAEVPPAVAMAMAQRPGASGTGPAGAAALLPSAKEFLAASQEGDAATAKDLPAGPSGENAGRHLASNYDPRTASVAPSGGLVLPGQMQNLAVLGTEESLARDGTVSDIQRFEFQGPASAAHRADAALMRPEIAASVSRQMVEVAAQAAGKPVELQLNPHELGRVRLRVTTTDSGVTVSIVAERPETLDLLRRNIEQLARDFRDIGFSDASFSFAQQDNQQERPGAYESSAELAPFQGQDSAAPVTDGIAVHLGASAQSGLDLRL